MEEEEHLNSFTNQFLTVEKHFINNQMLFTPHCILTFKLNIYFETEKYYLCEPRVDECVCLAHLNSSVCRNMNCV